MIIQQFFDQESFSYAYLLADETHKEAVLIDPVNTHIDKYQEVLTDRGLTLVSAVDTHLHADHITALGKLREQTACKTYIGRDGSILCSDYSLSDGMTISFGAYQLEAKYTPGHTDDSYCFILTNDTPAVFTGDTLLINGCGRTDFQNGNPSQLYHSLHNVLMALPDETTVYPGHDYNGLQKSSIGKERQNNPRLQWDEVEFVKNMNELNLPNPKFMDKALPANKNCGLL